MPSLCCTRLPGCPLTAIGRNGRVAGVCASTIARTPPLCPRRVCPSEPRCNRSYPGVSSGPNIHEYVSEYLTRKTDRRKVYPLSPLINGWPPFVGLSCCRRVRRCTAPMGRQRFTIYPSPAPSFVSNKSRLAVPVEITVKTRQVLCIGSSASLLAV